MEATAEKNCAKAGDPANGSFKTWNIAVLPGDGIGAEVVAEGVKVLNAVALLLLGVKLKLAEHPVGAAEYLRNGNPLPEEPFAALPLKIAGGDGCPWRAFAVNGDSASEQLAHLLA